MNRILSLFPIRKKHLSSLKGKLFMYTLLIIMSMTVLSIYSLTITTVYKQKIDTMFERNIALKKLADTIDMVDKELVVFLNTKSSTSLNNYMRSGQSLSEQSLDLAEKVSTYTEEELMVLDINNMIFNYLSEADIAIIEKRKTDVSAYKKRYANTLVLKNYMMDYIQQLNIRQLNSNAITYVYMSEQIRISSLLNIILILDLVLLSITIILKMSNSMIIPIIKLSHSAEEIAKGKFETDEITVETNDELQILARAFNKMKFNIHAYIEELKEKAQTEAKLNFQELENLKMQSLLNNARLFALQSQMNPHFLFNTINAGVQLSMIEGAEKTSEFLECMSRLFRYNIKQLDQAVTISQEINNIKDYYELLKVRFGSLITFEFSLDNHGLEYLMPPLILQPIVENAYLHGLSKKEEGGSIKIQVVSKEAFTCISIEDNGVGMTEDLVAMIQIILDRTKREVWEEQHDQKNDSKEQDIHFEHSNGIGLKNVTQRMELFYKQDCLISVISTKDIGTKFIINIPVLKEPV